VLALVLLLIGSLLALASTARALGPASVQAQTGETDPTASAGPRLTLAHWDLPAGYDATVEPTEGGAIHLFTRTEPGPGPVLLVSWASVVPGTQDFISGDPRTAEQAVAGLIQTFAQALQLDIQAPEELREVGFGREALGQRFRFLAPWGSGEGAAVLFTSRAAAAMLLALSTEGSAVDALRQYGPIAEARMDREAGLPWPARPSADNFESLALLRLSIGEPTDPRGALAAQNEAVRLAPDDPDRYLRRALSRRELGDQRGALADLDQALRLGNAPLYYLSRAQVRADLGDRGGALADLQQARALATAQGDADVLRRIEQASAEVER
jgi:tetratricopeptide (TPR) repeat protein